MMVSVNYVHNLKKPYPYEPPFIVEDEGLVVNLSIQGQTSEQMFGPICNEGLFLSFAAHKIANH